MTLDTYKVILERICRLRREVGQDAGTVEQYLGLCRLVYRLGTEAQKQQLVEAVAGKEYVADQT